MSKVPDVYRRQAAVLKALAHPTRLYVADLLSKGPLCVCKIRDRVGADLSTVSKHLSVMTAAGVLSREKRGLEVHYRLKTPCVTKFFSCTLNVMKASR
jgi:DNA-binding transcriptional ArsR family regulator